MVLLRHLLGDALRRLRLRQGRTLREVSASARVSLGYLSEVERGQKEASSELLAAICSALGAPLSQVLREVSDNFALAELQSEPVFADVIEPPIEVARVSHGAGSAAEDDSGEREQLPVGSVASERMARPAAGRIPAGTGPRVPAGASQLGAGQLGGAAHIKAGQLRPGQKLAAPGRMPIIANISVGEPAFEQVSRTVREITNMVPV
jgi:transcriptional regulator with XRE-family HTH domain